MKQLRKLLTRNWIDSAGKQVPACYAVEGLPDGQVAELLDQSHWGWQIQRSIDSKNQPVINGFASADEALAELQRIVESEEASKS